MRADGTNRSRANAYPEPVEPSALPDRQQFGDKKFIQGAMGSFHRRTADGFAAAENTTDLIRGWKTDQTLTDTTG